jgi:hypothetical protein
MRCVVGRWRDSLDKEDLAAFTRAVGSMSRADLYGAICAAHGSRPFGLTALKDCLNGRCICN